MRNKKIVIVGISVITLIFSVFLYFMLNSFHEESYRMIKIMDCKGKIEIIRNDIGKIDAYKNMHLENKDDVSVYDDSKAVLQLDEDKYLYVEPNTEFHIEAVGTEENSRTRIVLEKGSIISEIQKPLSDDSYYEIQTPNSTMSVRGTVFRVDVKLSKDGKSYTNVQVFDGTVASQLVFPDGSVSEKEVMIPAGAAIQAKGDEVDSEYVMTLIDGKEEIVAPIQFEELPLDTLLNLKTIIENKKNEVIISLPEVETLIEVKETEKNNQDSKDENISVIENLNGEITLPVEYQQEQTFPVIESPSLSQESKVFKVSFYSDGKKMNTVQVKDGDKISLPVLKKIGYNFQGWYADEDYEEIKELTVSKDIELYARWIPRDDTKIRIQHYVKKRGHSEYELVKTEEQTGKTGDTFSYSTEGFNQPLSINGLDSCFYIKHQDEVLSGVISADQPLEIKIYYDQGIQVNFYDINKNKILSMTQPYGSEINKYHIPNVSISKDGRFLSKGYFDIHGNNVATKGVLYENTNFYEEVHYRYSVEYYQVDESGIYPVLPIAKDYYYGENKEKIDLNHGDTSIMNKYLETGYVVDMENSQLSSTVHQNGHMTLKVYYKVKNKEMLTIKFKYPHLDDMQENEVICEYGTSFDSHLINVKELYPNLNEKDYKLLGWNDSLGNKLKDGYRITQDLEIYADIQFAYELVTSVQNIETDNYQLHSHISIKKYGYIGEPMIIDELDIQKLKIALDNQNIIPIEHTHHKTSVGEYGKIQGTGKDSYVVQFNRNVYTWTLNYQNGMKEEIKYRYGQTSNIDSKYSSLSENVKQMSVWYDNPNATGDEDKIWYNEIVKCDKQIYEISREKIAYYVTYIYQNEDGDYEWGINDSGLAYQLYDTGNAYAFEIPKDGYKINREKSKLSKKIIKDKIVSNETFIKSEEDLKKYKDTTNVLWVIYDKIT